MNKALFVLVSTGLLVAFATPVAQAAANDSPPPKPEATQMPSSGDDLSGDRLVLKSNVHSLVRLHDGTPNWVALRGTSLRVTQGKGDSDELLVVVDSVPCRFTRADGATAAKSGYNAKSNYSWTPFVGREIDCRNVPSGDIAVEKLVEVGEVYKLKRSELEQHGYFRSGWVYGALLVPYKYHFDDRSFSSAATIGPYLGYSMGSWGFNMAAVASAGLASLAVANPNGGGDTSTVQGFSLAVGLIGGVSKNNSPIQLGVLFGRDWAGSNSAVPYKHEGKTWAAVQIGFSFSQ